MTITKSIEGDKIKKKGRGDGIFFKYMMIKNSIN